jgi:hypothetical protein
MDEPGTLANAPSTFDCTLLEAGRLLCRRGLDQHGSSSRSRLRRLACRCPFATSLQRPEAEAGEARRANPEPRRTDPNPGLLWSRSVVAADHPDCGVAGAPSRRGSGPSAQGRGLQGRQADRAALTAQGRELRPDLGLEGNRRARAPCHRPSPAGGRDPAEPDAAQPRGSLLPQHAWRAAGLSGRGQGVGQGAQTRGPVCRPPLAPLPRSQAHGDQPTGETLPALKFPGCRSSPGIRRFRPPTSTSTKSAMRSASRPHGQPCRSSLWNTLGTQIRESRGAAGKRHPDVPA